MGMNGILANIGNLLIRFLPNSQWHSFLTSAVVPHLQENIIFKNFACSYIPWLQQKEGS